jgi:hypothetical protein
VPTFSGGRTAIALYLCTLVPNGVRGHDAYCATWHFAASRKCQTSMSAIRGNPENICSH